MYPRLQRGGSVQAIENLQTALSGMGAYNIGSTVEFTGMPLTQYALGNRDCDAVTYLENHRELKTTKTGAQIL